MMRVDFYIVNGEQEHDREIFACRLAEKAYKQGHRVVLRTTDEAQTYALDNLLWTFNPGSFVPHGCDKNDIDNPVRVEHELTADSQHDVLINLNEKAVIELTAFSRIAEIVNQDPSRRSLARQRYKQYRESGLEVNSHNVNK